MTILKFSNGDDYDPDNSFDIVAILVDLGAITAPYPNPDVLREAAVSYLGAGSASGWLLDHTGMTGDYNFSGGDYADSLTGGNGNEGLYGLGGRDQLAGNAGNDVLDGGTGGDLLDGGSGNDRHWGQIGADLLRSKGGNDRFWGGFGADTFVFSSRSGRDRIMDFKTERDLVDLSEWKAIEDYADVKSHASNHGDNLWITAGKDRLIIKDFAKDDLDRGDFSF